MTYPHAVPLMSNCKRFPFTASALYSAATNPACEWFAYVFHVGA